MDLFTEIRGIISRALAVEEQEVVPEANLQDELGADSLAFVGLVETISERYDIELDEDDLPSLDNVGQLVRLVESRIKSKS